MPEARAYARRQIAFTRTDITYGGIFITRIQQLTLVSHRELRRAQQYRFDLLACLRQAASPASGFFSAMALRPLQHGARHAVMTLAHDSRR